LKASPGTRQKVSKTAPPPPALQQTRPAWWTIHVIQTTQENLSLRLALGKNERPCGKITKQKGLVGVAQVIEQVQSPEFKPHLGGWGGRRLKKRRA
jgi:hypothetical protein